jgi:hypothetical protein
MPLRLRLTYANVIASLALFVALGGSAAAAFVVSSNQEIAPRTVFGSVKPTGANDNVVAGSLGTADLANSSVTTVKVANASITRAKLAVPAITGTGNTAFDRVTLPVGGSHTLLPVAGLGNLVATCNQFSATFQFHNSSGGDETVFMDDVAFTSIDTVAAGQSSPVTPGRFLNHITYQVGIGTGSTGRLATIEAFEDANGTSCVLQAQVASLTKS